MSERPFLVIGAPVHERAWVLPDWLAHLAKQDLPWENVILLLNYGRSSDSTLKIIRDAQDMLPWTVRVLIDSEDGDHVAHQSVHRRWNLDRYRVMTRLRNELLGWVRKWQPSYYLSLDTDILLPDGCIETLLEDMRGGKFDAVAPKVFMTPRGERYPNVMNLTDLGGRPKLEHEFTMIVDVVFAAVLMGPRLYNEVDYAPHNRGEDIGWGLNAQKAGMVMGLNPQVVCKHVMSPEMLYETDPRVGW